MNDNRYESPYIVAVNHHGEPADQLSARDIEVLSTALRLYHGDKKDVGASLREREHIKALCRRIVTPGLVWAASEEQ